MIKNLLYSLQRCLPEEEVDSSGFLAADEDGNYILRRAEIPSAIFFSKSYKGRYNFFMGHSRLITNGNNNNQPVLYDNITAIHNGIIVNCNELWGELKLKPQLEIDSEVIPAFCSEHLKGEFGIEEIAELILKKFKGVVCSAIAFKELGKLLLISNNGSLFFGYMDGKLFFASERFFLNQLGCEGIEQILNSFLVVDIPSQVKFEIMEDIKNRNRPLVHNLGSNLGEEKELEFNNVNVKRCTKCVLPETMPLFHSTTTVNVTIAKTIKSKINLNQKNLYMIFWILIVVMVMNVLFRFQVVVIALMPFT